MRVIAGKARSLRLKSIEGMDTRPTTDRIKETLFNMINDDLYGASFLDLFSGSGGIGIEALSRRGQESRFCGEQAGRPLPRIQDNLKFTRLAPEGEVLVMDVFRALDTLAFRGESFSLIFMDPPYDRGLEKEVLSRLKASPLVTEETLLIVEASMETDFSYLEEFGYEVVKRKEYKTNVHMFLQRTKGADT